MCIKYILAIFIDIDIEGSKHLHDDNEVNYWSYLPDLILEKIFAHLTIRERFYASMVCRNWYRGFHLPYVWSTFTLEDSTLTRRKFNYYYGWQVNYILLLYKYLNNSNT